MDSQIKAAIIGAFIAGIFAVVVAIMAPTPMPLSVYTPPPVYPQTPILPTADLSKFSLDDAKGNLIFTESFIDNANGWTNGNNGDFGYYLSAGQYYIDPLNNKYADRILLPITEKLDDFIIGIEAGEEGTSQSGAYGVVLREVDHENGYYFLVYNGGKYTFYKLRNDEVVYIIPWTDSDLIKKDISLNSISVLCEGSKFTFFINGNKVDSCEDSTFAKGSVGIAACAYESDSLPYIAFDNINIWKLKNSN